MRPYYQALIELNANPTIEVAEKYLVELLRWFSMRLPMENPAKLTKEIDRNWVSYSKRAGAVVVGDTGEGFLTDGMFRQCLAQLPIIENVPNGELIFRGLFKECKWDYDQYVDPAVGENEEVWLIDI